MELAFLIVLGALAAGLALLLGLALGRYVWPTVDSAATAALATAQTEVARLNEEYGILRNHTQQLEAEIRAEASEKHRFAEEAARLTERVNGSMRQLEQQTGQSQSLEAQRENAIAETQTAVAEIARLSERETALTEKIREQAAQLADLQKQHERLIAAEEGPAQSSAASQFLRDVRVHIDGLAGKRYQDNDKLLAHDCVLMFVPIEGALAAALKRDPELFVYAWDRRVVLVSPSTLLMTMRTVASIWRYLLQGENAQEIARLAGDLCDKVSMSLCDLNVVAEKIKGAAAAHEEAVRRLSTGRGNALSIGDRIRSLGVKTKRPVPTMLIDGMAITAVDEEAA